MRAPELTLVATLTLMVGCGSTPSEEVIVYTSVDDVFARPVAERFEQATGIVVRLNATHVWEQRYNPRHNRFGWGRLIAVSC